MWKLLHYYKFLSETLYFVHNNKKDPVWITSGSRRQVSREIQPKIKIS